MLKLFQTKRKLKILENEIKEQSDEILFLKSKNNKLQQAVELLKTENQNLLQKLESIPPLTQNQRGAGRKKTCSQEDISLVKGLCTQGCKVSEIVQKLNQDTDKKWTHSQVTYIKNRYLSN